MITYDAQQRQDIFPYYNWHTTVGELRMMKYYYCSIIPKPIGIIVFDVRLFTFIIVCKF